MFNTRKALIVTRKALIVAALGVAATVAMAGCTPHAGDTCDPSKDFSYLSTHTQNGKTVTVRLVCKQVGVDTTGRGQPDRYEWVKV
jgi:hypothetical protein